jgi:hypothetical protein
MSAYFLKHHLKSNKEIIDVTRNFNEEGNDEKGFIDTIVFGRCSNE